MLYLIRQFIYAIYFMHLPFPGEKLDTQFNVLLAIGYLVLVWIDLGSTKQLVPS